MARKDRNGNGNGHDEAGGIAVADLPLTLQDLMPTKAQIAQYRDGFYRVEILDQSFPKRSLPLTLRHDPLRGLPRGFGWSPEHLVVVRQLVCRNVECENCRKRTVWESEQAYRSGQLLNLFPEEEHEWDTRAKLSLTCPKCKQPGHYREIQPGIAYQPRIVPQIWWLTAEERARFDLVMSPDRSPKVESETVERDNVKRTVRRGVVQKPLSATRFVQIGHTQVRREQFIGDQVRLHFLTGDPKANPLRVINGYREFVAGSTADEIVAKMQELLAVIADAAVIVGDPEVEKSEREAAQKTITDCQTKVKELRGQLKAVHDSTTSPETGEENHADT